MKIETLAKLVLGALLLAGGPWALRAEDYSIAWYELADGGGTSTSAVYSVGGTIGQHDAGLPMSGGNYSLSSGFWGLLSVTHTPGAPLLKIFLTATNTAVVS